METHLINAFKKPFKADFKTQLEYRRRWCQLCVKLSALIES